MKKLIIILSFALSLSIHADAHNNLPSLIEDELVYTDASLSFSMKSNSALILSTEFNEDSKFISIETESVISLLQVVNEAGEIEYQLPIGSKNLQLALADFAVGNYQINLLVEGQKNFVTTFLDKKI